MKRVLVIAGPTASGKTHCALALARALGGEIVGADSVQVYRRLDIGSAKPSSAELQGIPHHLTDLVDLREDFDAARYAAAADLAIEDVVARGKVPIVAGGTGLYLRALVRGLADGIPRDPELRRRLQAEAGGGVAALAAMHARLAEVDPVYAAKIESSDPIRIVRALEVWEISGEPISAHHRRHQLQPPRYEALFVALEVERATLREKIRARTHTMFEAGWVAEVEALLGDGYEPDLKPLKSVGYAEVVRHVREKRPLDSTMQDVFYATVAFAKRQRTWFRGERDVSWCAPEALASAEWRERIERFFRGNEPRETAVS